MPPQPTGAGSEPQVPAVEVEHLGRRFGPFVALDDVSLSVRRGEFFSLLGPSGCGKTTLLRILAGLDLPDQGTVRIAGQDVAAVPAHRRPVNTVFQSYALFPHLAVRDNVAFGLRMKKVPPAETAERVARVLELVQITALADRRPAQLSGGQKQRVALARALVNEPQVLLLDEPLGALDLKLRKELQVELLELQRRLGITFVFVTHDQEEALVMSDRIAVMRAGRIEQLGESEALYERPRNRFVSQFLGSCNLLPGTVTTAGDGGFAARTAVGELRVEGPGPVPGAEVTLAIRPEKVRLSVAGPGFLAAGNRVPVRVEQVLYVGATTQYRLRAREVELQAFAVNAKGSGDAWDEGQEAVAELPASAIVVLED